MEGLVTEQARWFGRRVFITGASGLLGSWLTRRLVDDGADVVVLMKDHDPQSELLRSETIRRTRVVDGSLEDFRSLERAMVLHEVDCVFHLGAQTQVTTAFRAPLITFEANIRGTYNVLEACRVLADLVKSVVVASSDKAYGDSKHLPYTEDMALAGRYPYDASKASSDLIAQSYAYTYGLPIAIARCGNIYGGGDLNWSRIVPGTFRSLIRGEPPQLRSDGKSTRDYLYVEDVVSAYLLLAEALEEQESRGEAFNFAEGDALSVLEVVRLMQEVTGAEALRPAILDVAKGEIRHQHLDSSKAQRTLGWRANFGIREGLTETAGWYRSYLSESAAPHDGRQGLVS